ncbi:dTMP kinase [Actinosynnema sp. CS-041913]|uniref:dTMP kinase n=1 Tax=Actinosynnema sp. CS-041913 TaxID=3239917 RepID=UPI003D89E541
MNGLLVTVDGPGGAGKSTTVRHLHDLLTAQGHEVHATTEPSHDLLGRTARDNSDTYSGHALACLVAADRYHHLTTDIRPHLDQGHIVLCDRYVASSYVLQRMDGVPLHFIETLNAAADTPGLAVILTADPTTTADRIAHRGTRHRFETGVTTSRTESDLYEDTIRRLTERGYPILAIDTTTTASDQVAAMIAQRVNQLATTDNPESTTP